MKHYNQKASWGGKGYFVYTSISLFITERNQDRNSNGAGSQAGAVAEAMEGAVYLDLLPMTCSSHVLIEPRLRSSGMASPIMGWSSPIDH